MLCYTIICHKEMYKMKFVILFLSIVALAIAPISVAYAKSTPNIPLKDQMAVEDSFEQIILTICRERHPRNIERCVLLIKSLGNRRGNTQELWPPVQQYKPPPPVFNNKDCGYLIQEESKPFPCF